MRKLLTLAFLMVLTIGFLPQRLVAQVTGFSQPYIHDSIVTNCLLPANRNIMAQIQVAGAILPADSITVAFNFGDAYAFSYKIPAAQSITAYASHDYSFTGTFTTQIIFTAA